MKANIRINYVFWTEEPLLLAGAQSGLLVSMPRSLLRLNEAQIK